MENNFNLNADLIDLHLDVKSPEDAIYKSGMMLVKTALVELSYLDGMLHAYKDLGPYIVIAPQVAMPHSKPGLGVNKPSYAFARLKKPIPFGHSEHDPVHIVIPVAGIDHTSHIGMLRNIAGVLSDPKNFAKLLKTENKQEIATLFNNGTQRKG
ncbi:MAG: PTS sugar transporter subunit IIA [Anaerolineaceae bacterium]|nr:PTS sugar transporter subunit IIA [Anaerolineaceae bacterium]